MPTFTLLNTMIIQFSCTSLNKQNKCFLAKHWLSTFNLSHVINETVLYLSLQFFYVLAVILLGEMVLATAVFIIYFVPEARDNFLRSQPEKILSTAIYRYMDDEEVKQWVDKIQSEVKAAAFILQKWPLVFSRSLSSCIDPLVTVLN